MTEKITAALDAEALGDLERAASIWEDAARADPRSGLLAFKRVNALFELDRTADAVTLFEDLQLARPLATTPRQYRLFGRTGPAFPEPFRLVESLTGRLYQHTDYWSVVKLGAGSRFVELDLAEGESLVVEGLLAKRIGDDECCRIVIDNGVHREVAVFNARAVGLRSSSQIMRIPLEHRLRPFRFVMTPRGSRLWMDGLRVLRSDMPLPGREGKFRMGLIESVENLDTDFMVGNVRVAIGLSSDDPDDFAPFDDWEESVFRLAVAHVDAGRVEAAASCLESALCGRVIDEGIHGAVAVASRIAARREEEPAARPAIERSLQTIVERLRSLGRPELSEQLSISTTRRGDVAVRCEKVTVLFARAPHRVNQPLEIAKRLLSPVRYKAENYRPVVEEVSLELRYGSVLGIIGNNGAGKSTLLRAIAGIVDYQGRIEVNGVSRLLVMGVGIQEDLTGRENVRLGCLYLGMRRRDIDARVDEILDFAELKEAQDLPYRYYSDGMKARLLFSIATSAEPDILLLDELLGAGDVRFRAKAAKRMEKLIERSKAMIVVTHNMSFVRDRATEVIYMKSGRVRFCGDPHRAVDFYFEDNRLDTQPGADVRSSLTEEI